MFIPTAYYSPLCGNKFQVLIFEMDHYVLGCRMWWDLPSISPLLNPQAKEHKNKFITNHWARWVDHLPVRGAACACFRKGVDRAGRETSWHRCLHEAAVSILGLLAVLCYRATRSTIKDGTRQKCADQLGEFLGERLGEDSFSILIAAGASPPWGVGIVPRTGRVEVTVESGHIFLSPLQGHPACAGMQRFCKRVLKLHGLRLDAVPLVSFLLEAAMDGSMENLYAQLLTELAVAVEEFADTGAMAKNPCDGTAPMHGSRWDERLRDTIVLGDGATGSGPRSALPRLHCKSFMKAAKYRLVGKRGLNPSAGQASILVRYRDVGRGYFENMEDVAIACDGSRIGGREVLLVLAVGRDASGAWRSMWAPPQVVLECKKHAPRRKTCAHARLCL